MGRLLKGCLIGCGVLVVLAVVGGVLFFRWFGKTFAGPLPPPPKVGPQVALRPTFLLKNGEDYSAGTAVAVRLNPKDRPILITALHLFGPNGGLEKDLAPGELDRTVKAIRLTPIGGTKPVATAKGALRKKGPTLTEDNEDLGMDLAAFKLLPGAKVNALPLAARSPGPGEPVWMVGDTVDHEPQAQRLFGARALVGNRGGLVIQFQQPIELQACSGAPVINARKEVVGLLVSGGGGMGVLNPAESIRARLAEEGLK